MKIVLVNQGAQLGGGERSLIDLVASLRMSEPDCHLVLVVGGEGPLKEELERLACDVRLLPTPSGLAGIGDSALKFAGRVGAGFSLAWRAPGAGLAAAGYVRDLSRLLREIRPDLVHTNDNKSHLLAALARTGGVPIVWHVRDFIGSRGLIRRALSRASSRAAGAIANSHAVGLDAMAVLPGLPVEVVYNAIDLELFSPGTGNGRWLDELAHMTVAPEGTIRVGLVATFGRWKGQDLFLEALARLLSDPPASPVRFYVVGGAIYRTAGSQFTERELRSKARALGVDQYVGFTGFHHDTAEIYRALDIVVHASTQPEPFGRAIVEAMACARPVIVSRAGGAVELFTEQVDAIGFTPGDANGLALAIRTLMHDPAGRARLGERARMSAVERFSRERLGREVAAAWARFLSRPSISAP